MISDVSSADESWPPLHMTPGAEGATIDPEWDDSMLCRNKRSRKGNMKRCLPVLLILLFSSTFSAAEQPAALAQTFQPTASVAARQSGEQVWADLMEGNQRFVSGQPKPRELVLLRHRLATGQHPRVVILTCSDSRVPPELVFDQNLGDLFVIRAAGNVAGSIELGSIEYAVEHLGSTVLVVLGHEKCGAVTAACSGEKMPTANLQAIMDKIDPAVLQARSYAKPDALLNASIRENVHRSARDVLANSEVLRSAHEQGKLSVVEAIYRLESGEVERLPSSVDSH